MFQDIDLRELSQLQGPERAFVSLYASGPEGLAALDGRERRVRALLDDPAEAEHFAENMTLLRRILEEHPFESKGLCVFACWALDFARRYPLPVAVPDLLRVGAAPYLRPLAELQDEYENFLVVAADNRVTRILHVTSAVAEPGERIKGDVKNAVKVGGWSQQRYARRRDLQLLHYAKEVGDVLDDLCRHERFGRIVLLGSQETMREIEAVLSTQVAEKVVGTKAVDLRAGDQALLDEAYALYFGEERESEARLWDRIKNEYLGGSLAAVGPEDVLRAALVGRVEAMIVTRAAKIAGTRCRDCQNVAAGLADACPVCGSASVFGMDLVD
ncbi:MAG TPA: Vms1/Ankzf1 family peptidyl-tRNA hydrolase, partial [Isosphaeraceae bacterium]